MADGRESCSTRKSCKVVFSGRISCSNLLNAGYPTALSQVKDESPRRFLRQDLKEGVEGAVAGDHLQVLAQHQERFPDGVDDVLGVPLRRLGLTLRRLRRVLSFRVSHAVNHVLYRAIGADPDLHPVPVFGGHFQFLRRQGVQDGLSILHQDLIGSLDPGWLTGPPRSVAIRLITLVAGEKRVKHTGADPGRIAGNGGAVQEVLHVAFRPGKLIHLGLEIQVEPVSSALRLPTGLPL